MSLYTSLLTLHQHVTCIKIQNTKSHVEPEPLFFFCIYVITTKWFQTGVQISGVILDLFHKNGMYFSLE